MIDIVEILERQYARTGLKYMLQAANEIEQLREEIEPLRIALGLLTTIKPTMEIDITDPVGMAQQIAVHVAAEIKRLREEKDKAYDSGFIVGTQKAPTYKENQELRDEIDRLRGAYEQERKDCINLTEKVIPNLRAETERMREELLSRHAKIRRQAEEIERLREQAERDREAINGAYSVQLGLNAQVEKLRQEKADILAAKEIVLTPPAIPKSFVIQELQKANVALHTDIARLQNGVRCPHCDELRLGLGQARRELAQLSGLLRDGLTSNIPEWRERVREALGNE